VDSIHGNNDLRVFSSYGYSNGQDSKTTFECTMCTQRNHNFAQFLQLKKLKKIFHCKEVGI
jgi:hypothetical protein